MLLREFFIKPKQHLVEGGNLKIGDIEADRIDSAKRAQIVPVIDSALTAINSAFKQVNNNIPLWMPDLLSSKKFLAGSSFHFFDRLKISDADFARVKRTVGDIDTQVDKNMSDQIRNWLGSLSPGAQLGPARFAGMDAKDPAQVLTLWQFPDIVVTNNQGQETPITIQIDLELKPFAKGEPTSWAKFSASSDWEDLSQGIKGVFHKWIIRSLTSLTEKTFLLRKVGARTTKEKTTTDNMISFAVKSKEGGGLRPKYAPVISQDTGSQEIKDGLPVYTELPTTGYEQDVSKIFASIFGDRLPQKQAKALEPKFWSFVGIAELMRDYLDPQEQNKVADNFINIVFGPAAQRLYADDLRKDLEEKNAAVNKMYEILGVEPPDKLNSMVLNYASGFKGRSKPVTEEVAASPRQGIEHLSKMNDIQFIEFAKSIQKDLKGKIDTIPVTLKVDGLGARFGKDVNGTPFFESSSSGPIFKPGSFSAFAQGAGHDGERLARAQHYDELFDLITGSEFIKKLPNDTKVFCEIMYNPMAEQTERGLKFVTVSYDKKLLGNKVSIVPHYVQKASDNSQHPQSEKIKEWLLTQSTPDIKFIDDRLNYEEALDVSGTIDPVLSLNDQSIAVLQSRKAADKEEKAKIKAAIQAVKTALADQILNNPKLVDKYKLGQDIEGIILHRPDAPRLKITTGDFQQSKQGEKSTSVKEDANNNGVAIIFGRFNPPHQGHKAAWQAASNYQNWYVGTNQNTEGPDDPLPFSAKMEAMKAVAAANPPIPDFENHLMATNSWRHLAREAYLKQLKNEGKSEGDQVSASLIVCTDANDKDAYLRMVASGNGQPNKMGNVPYNFTSVEWQPTPRLSSATSLRNAVKQGDREGFSQAAGISSETLVAGTPYFDLVAKYLMPYKEKQDEKERLKREREATKAAKLASNKLKIPKTKKPAPTQDIAEEYIKLKSALIERIIKNDLERT